MSLEPIQARLAIHLTKAPQAMPTVAERKQRRIEQFAQYPRLMGLRRHKVVEHDDRFIIFDEMRPKNADAPKIEESATIATD